MLILLELVHALGAVIFSIVVLFFMCFLISNDFRETVNGWINDINSYYRKGEDNDSPD